MKWMEFECETSLLTEMPEARQHFFYFFHDFSIPRVVAPQFFNLRGR